jgi:hypothetical protein
MATNAKLQIAIEASNNATGQLKSLENDLRGVSTATDSSGMGFGKLVGAIGLGNLAANAASSAFNALGGFLKGTITAAEEAEATQAQLSAVCPAYMSLKVPVGNGSSIPHSICVNGNYAGKYGGYGESEHPP